MLRTYEEIIQKYAKSGEDFAIQNSNQDHASFLIKTFFETGKEEIGIFTGSLYSGVYGNQDVVNAAADFLNRDNSTRIRIVFQQESARNDIINGPFIKPLLKGVQRKGAIELFEGRKDFEVLRNHFAVMDKKAYRYEFDKEKMQAVANFGDKEMALKLSNIFDTIVRYSNKVDIHLPN